MIRLNIGSGRNRLEGFVSVDKYHPKADIKTAAWDLPYENGEVDFIYCSHTLEHIEAWNLDKTLKEFNRVLKNGGGLEIVVPDLEKAIKAWLDSNYKTRWEMGMWRIFGHQRKEGDTHYTGFTKRRLENVLKQYGFEIIETRNQPSRFRKPEEYIKNGDIFCWALKEKNI